MGTVHHRVWKLDLLNRICSRVNRRSHRVEADSPLAQALVEPLEKRRLLAAAPAFELYRDAAATQPLLNAVYANVTEDQVRATIKNYVADDLRAAPGIQISGQRVDGADFPTSNWTIGGVGRSQLGLTEGSDDNWDLFVYQADGYVKINSDQVRLMTRSANGSRFFIDLNHDDVFEPASEVYDNSYEAIYDGLVQEGHRTPMLAAGVYKIRIQYLSEYHLNVLQLVSAPLPDPQFLGQYESNMVKFAQFHEQYELTSPIQDQGTAQTLLQYDPALAYLNVYLETKDLHWLDVARQMAIRYVHDYALNPAVGQVDARISFLEGPRKIWQMEQDPTVKAMLAQGIISAAENGEYARDTTPLSETAGLVDDSVRVVARVIDAYVEEYNVSGTVRTRLADMVNQSLQHLELFTSSQYPSADFELPNFWIMLAGMALFKVDDTFGDARIVPAEIAAADHIYDTFYVPSDEAIAYSNLNLESGGGDHASSDLSVEFAAWYLQLYQRTGLQRFRDRAHILFERGVKDAYLGDFDGNGQIRGSKQWRENYWLSSGIFSDLSYGSGDTNRDEQVSFADLVAVAQHYGQQSGAVVSQGDLNFDGKVNFGDLVMVAQNYGTLLDQTAPAIFAVTPIRPAKKPTSAVSRPAFKPLAAQRHSI
jgi:hypothetical protein